MRGSGSCLRSSPKNRIPKGLNEFSPISCITTYTKLLGDLWLHTLPTLCCETLQTAFVPPQSRGAEAVCMIERSTDRDRARMERARLWCATRSLTALEWQRMHEQTKSKARQGAKTPLWSAKLTVQHIWQRVFQCDEAPRPWLC